MSQSYAGGCALHVQEGQMMACDGDDAIDFRVSPPPGIETVSLGNLTFGLPWQGQDGG